MMGLLNKPRLDTKLMMMIYILGLTGNMQSIKQSIGGCAMGRYSMLAAHMPACASSMKGNLEADSDVIQGCQMRQMYS